MRTSLKNGIAAPVNYLITDVILLGSYRVLGTKGVIVAAIGSFFAFDLIVGTVATFGATLVLSSESTVALSTLLPLEETLRVSQVRIAALGTTVILDLVFLVVLVRGVQQFRRRKDAQSAGSNGRGASKKEHDDLGGEWKHDTAEAERAHRQAQRREPPVNMGQYVSFPVIEVNRGEQQAHGKVEKFRIFVDEGIPSDIQTGDMVCVQIFDWATNERGQKVGAHARFEQYGRC